MKLPLLTALQRAVAARKTARPMMCAIAIGAAAFSVQGQVQSFDYGDAPKQYPVAAHSFFQRFFLGRGVDVETSPQISADALGDDKDSLTGADDEDGVEFDSLPLVPGTTTSVTVVASLVDGGRLDAWVDFNADGDWDDSGEQIFKGQSLISGVNKLSFAVPAAAKSGVTTFARFRVSFGGGLPPGPLPTGAVPPGEVEDYAVSVGDGFDFGDAPEKYPVLLSQDGARHKLNNSVFLGFLVDGEPDGQPSAAANGDDINPPRISSDEDGVKFLTPFHPGGPATIQVIAPTGQLRLDAWIDFNANMSWDDPGEQILTSAFLNMGPNNFTINVPANAKISDTFSRFRVSFEGGLKPTGPANDGEVEDHLVKIEQALLDFSDAGEGYPVLLSQDGARHVLNAKLFLGQRVDVETDGFPSAAANGDDLNPSSTAPDDEDGIVFLSPLNPGQTAQIQATASNRGLLDAWIDFDGSRSWDAGEQIFLSEVLESGPNVLAFTVPANAKEGETYARFRFSSNGGLGPKGLAVDGEVEDYLVKIETELLDYGDAPDGAAAPIYPTTKASDGARHRYLKGFNLGRLIDVEADGQPGPLANGDDSNPANADDEDGVTFVGPLQPGMQATVEVVLTGQQGLLDAWIDFNVNRNWNDSGEQIFTNQVLVSGANVLHFNVPSSAPIRDDLFARFRLSRRGSLKPSGLAADGEVEDYRVAIVQRPENPCDSDRTHRGTNFWVTFPGNYAPDPENPVNIRIYVVGPRTTSGTVSIPGLGFSTNFVIGASREFIAVLPRAAELGEANDIVEKKGIHVTASQEVAVYGMNKVKWTTDGYLGLPSDVIGRKYVVQGFGNEFTGVPDLNGTQFALVANEDNTTVNITPVVSTLGHAAGVPFAVKLNQGQTYQLRNTNDFNNDLTGTLIEADKPISVFGSHQTANVPGKNVFFADHLVEQLLPVERAAIYHLVMPLATRNGATYRFTATQDGTSVSVNGALAAVLNAGQFHERFIPGSARVTSSKPIFVAQYANSSDYDGVVNSDPFMIVVPSVYMWLNAYMITAPDLGFASHYVNIIAPNSVVGALAFDGVAIPAGLFTPIPGTAFSATQKQVSPGVHTATANLPFGMTVYGWAEYESYGFPAGMFFGDTQPPQLTCPDKVTVTLGNSSTVFSCTAAVPDFRSKVQVSDNCGVPERINIQQDPAPGTAVGPGTHIVTLSTVDINNNVGFCEVEFEVIDPTPLRLTCPQNLAVTCNTNGGAYVQFDARASRSCGPVAEPRVESTPASGSFFPEGTTTVTSSVKDPDTGQVLTCTFTVTVRCTGGTPSITHVSISNGSLTFAWEGSAVLEKASSVNGPWSEVTEAKGSYNVIPRGNGEFYRLKVKP